MTEHRAEVTAWWDDNYDKRRDLGNLCMAHLLQAIRRSRGSYVWQVRRIAPSMAGRCEFEEAK